VVLPCYNSHRYLQMTLDSLRAQTFRDFETILVDDGSDDPDTLAFIDSLADDVRVLRQPITGLPAARNTGILHAKG
jgi:glycosyltransferase involved in cell wall biosynthesis